VDWGYTENGGLRALLPVSPELIKLYGWGCLKWDIGKWKLNELYIIEGAVQNLDNAMKHRMSSFIKSAVSIYKKPNACGKGCTTITGDHIDLLDRSMPPTESPKGNLSNYYVYSNVNGTPDINFDQWTVVHELGHAWDFKNNGNLSWNLIGATKGGFGPDLALGCDPNGRLPGCNHWFYRYGGTPATGADYNFDWREDFAESVAAYVFPDVAYQAKMNRLDQIRTGDDQFNNGRYGIEEQKFYPILFQLLYNPDYRQTSRWQYIDGLISGR